MACMDIHPNPGPIENDKILSIFHLNIRSLRHKLSYLCDVASEYDIVCISESHLDDTVHSNDIILDGFCVNPFRKDRTSHGGGLVIYISDKLYVKRQPHLEIANLEMIWLEVVFPMYSFLVCCVYRPPNSSDDFWDNFYLSLEQASTQNGHIVVTGDLNVDLLTNHNHKLIDIMNFVGLHNHVNFPTRFGSTRQSLLDLVLVKECSISHTEVIDIDRVISDHNATLVDVHVQINIRQKFKREIWDYKNGNFEKLNTELEELNWNSLLNQANDIDEMCGIFTTKFLELANQNIPRKTITIRPNDKPWFNSELRREIRKRDRLRKKALNKNSLIIYEQYKKQRNYVNNLKKETKQSFYSDIHGLIDTYSNNNNQDFWKLVRKLTKTSGQSVNIPPLLNPNTGEVVVSDLEKATLFNNYFANISRIDDDDSDLPYFPDRTVEFIENIDITESEIIDIIGSLKLNKASGMDDISHKMLKNTVRSVSKPLLVLFNKILDSSNYPSKWKEARVMPIFKKGDHNIISNYRPIALLSCVGKLFERIIHKHIHNFLLTNNLFYKFQSGFLPNNSTVYQLLEIYHSICMDLENKRNSGFIFCDVSKAFDRVWHRGLLLKLKSHGIKGSLLSLLTSYLTDRKHCVFLNDTVSSFQVIQAGVPQGSVLGPLMFLLYVNDIAENLINTSRLFADDTSVSSSSSNSMEIKHSLEHDLNTILEWSETWKIKFNPSKTEFLFIGNNHDDLDIVFGDTRLNPTKSHKHLGITFSSNAKWTEHIDTICKTALKEINVLKKLKFTISRNSLNKIYNTFILPILEYGCEVWGGCSKSDEEKLEKVQLEAARLVTGLPIFSSRESLYLETGWETLKDRRYRRRLTVLHRIYNNNAPDFLQDILSTYSRSNVYTLRNPTDLTIPNYRLQITRNSFFPATIHDWNSLDINIRQETNLLKFKNHLKANSPITTVPKHFFVGDRRLNILHTRLRRKCSSLNSDLFRVNLNNLPNCRCGNASEDATHYLLHCKLFTQQRSKLFQSLSSFPIITLDLLLFGNPELPYSINESIFHNVQKFIKETKRF